MKIKLFIEDLQKAESLEKAVNVWLSQMQRAGRDKTTFKVDSIHTSHSEDVILMTVLYEYVQL